MRLLELELRNVKSFAEALVKFRPGVNGLLGPNGAGKSTVLQAIGLTLFDSLGPTIGQFVREGQKSGHIRVRLLSSRDDQTYDIHRVIGGRTAHYVHNCDEDYRVCEGKTDVLTFVSEQIRSGDGPHPQILFEKAVGIRQGTFQAPFLLSPAPRRDYFGPLLGLEKYRNVASRLGEVRNYGNDLVLEGQSALDQRSGRLETLPDLRRQLQNLTSLVQELESETEELESLSQNVSQQLEKLEELSGQLRELQNQEGKLTEEAARLEGRLARLQDELASARQAARQVEAHANAFAAFTEADSDLVIVREKIQDSQRKREQRSRLEGEESQIEIRIREADTQLAGLDAFRARKEELQPSVDRSVALQAELQGLSTVDADVAGAEAQASGLRQDREKGLEVKSAIERELRIAEQTQFRISQCSRSLDTWRSARDGLRHKQAGEATKLQQAEEQLRELDKAVASEDGVVLCPVCEEELDPSKLESLTSRLRAAAKLANAKIQGLQQEIATGGQELLRLETERESLYKQFGDCRGQTDLEECVALLDARENELSEVSATLKTLRDRRIRRDAAQGEYDDLESSRAEFNLAQTELARRTDLMSDREQLLTLLHEVGRKLADFASAAEDEQELEERRRELVTRLEANREGHTQYLTHQKAAMSRGDVEAALEDSQGQATEIQSRIRELLEEKSDIESRYSRPLEDRTRRQLQDLHVRKSGRESEMKVRRQELAQVSGEVGRLEAVAKERDRLIAELRVLRDRASRVEWMRSLMRDALPIVTGALIQTVSNLANANFGQLTNDYTRQLRWDQDFGIVLRVGAEERSFPQLSGGEQMAASLAVTLALLQRLSNVKFVFLDEPTSNLDVERRSLLAEQLSRLTSLEQLIVISHDDTFEEHISHAIRLAPGPEGSVVVELD